MDKAKDKKKNKGNNIEDLEQEAAMNLAGWQKALADYQNLQKETEKRLGEYKDFSLQMFLNEVLPIFDNLYVAISHIPESNKKESWAVGLEHILRMWEMWLEEKGVKKIDTVGKKLDTHMHEAVETVNDTEKEDQEITKEVLAGFMHNDTVIRPARVIVNINPAPFAGSEE